MKVFLLWRIDNQDGYDKLLDVYENRDDAEKARDFLTDEGKKEDHDCHPNEIYVWVVYDYDVLNPFASAKKRIQYKTLARNIEKEMNNER